MRPITLAQLVIQVYGRLSAFLWTESQATSWLFLHREPHSGLFGNTEKGFYQHFINIVIVLLNSCTIISYVFQAVLFEGVKEAPNKVWKKYLLDRYIR